MTDVGCPPAPDGDDAPKARLSPRYEPSPRAGGAPPAPDADDGTGGHRPRRQRGLEVRSLQRVDFAMEGYDGEDDGPEDYKPDMPVPYGAAAEVSTRARRQIDDEPPPSPPTTQDVRLVAITSGGPRKHALLAAFGDRPSGTRRSRARLLGRQH